MKLATPDAVLVTEPRSIADGRRLAEVAKVLGASRNAADDRYRVVTIPSVPAYRAWDIVRVWPSSTSVLTVNGRVLVPTYRHPERDAAALAVYGQ